MRVAKAEGEDNERDTQADTSDGEETLNMLERIDHGSADGGSDRVELDGAEGVAVDDTGKSFVAESGGEISREDLRPDGTRDTVSKGRADAVGGKVQTSHDGELLVLDVGLQRSLGRVWEHTTSNTEDNLGADDTGLGGARGVTTVADEQTKGDKEEAGTEDDEHFEAANLVDNETEDGACDNTGKGVEGADASGGRDAKVKGDTQDGEEVIALHSPGKVEHAGHAHGSPDGAILYEGKGDERVRGSELPEDEERDGEEADDKRSNDMSLAPLSADTTGDGERDENEGKDRDDEDYANDVEEPEELDDKVGEAKLSEGRGVAIKQTLLAGATADDGETDDEREGANGVDDAPHGWQEC